jgi:hypothetical protein
MTRAGTLSVQVVEVAGSELPCCPLFATNSIRAKIEAEPIARSVTGEGFRHIAGHGHRVRRTDRDAGGNGVPRRSELTRPDLIASGIIGAHECVQPASRKLAAPATVVDGSKNGESWLCGSLPTALRPASIHPSATAAIDRSRKLDRIWILTSRYGRQHDAGADLRERLSGKRTPLHAHIATHVRRPSQVARRRDGRYGYGTLRGFVVAKQTMSATIGRVPASQAHERHEAPQTPSQHDQERHESQKDRATCISVPSHRCRVMPAGGAYMT